MNNIAICLSSDNNYVQHLGAAISSVLKNKNADDFINIYIIDGGIQTENIEKLKSFEQKYDCKVEFVKPIAEKLKNCVTFRGDYISVATYYRLLIPEIIPNEDRVIYLDCDMIIRKSLKELYGKDFGNNLVLGVRDVGFEGGTKRLRIEKYINAGMLLMNSKQMREENTVEKIFNWINDNKDKIECHDQDVINAACAGRIEYIENIYNAQVRKNNYSEFSEIEDPAILHFISPKKPWTLWKPLDYTKWGKEYFEALKNTPWEGFISEYKKKALLYLPLRCFYPTGFLKNLLRGIFSVRNTPDYAQKVVTIFFVPIKFKRRDIEKKNAVVKNKLFAIEPIDAGSHIKLTIFGIKIKVKPWNFGLQNFVSRIIAREVYSVIEVTECHKKTFSRFLDCNVGKSVAIWGCGPTVQHYNNELNTVNIALNKALFMDNVNFAYSFAQDANILKTCEGYIDKIKDKKDTVKFIGNFLQPKHHLNMPVIKESEKYNIFRYFSAARMWLPAFDFGQELFSDITLHPLADFSSISFAALHFAFYTHPDKIYLIGLDTNVGGINIFDNLNVDLKHAKDGNYDIKNMLSGYVKFKEFAEKYYPDVEIVSVNPVGLKGVFKDVYTQSYVNEHPELLKEGVEIIECKGYASCLDLRAGGG